MLLCAVWPAAAQVRLKEFLAVNCAGIRDSDDTPQGWIELWNSNQTAKATLTGMKLTNGTDTWTLPAVEIMPDEHMVVWASGKNRTVVTESLHTNFTIPAAGGALTLENAAAAVISSFANYPAQSADVSWGRDEVDTLAIPALTGYYTDALRLSAFWHKDRDRKMAAGPLWDFDRAFASADDRSVAWMNRVVANPNNGIWRANGSDYGTDWFNKSTDAVGVQTPVWWHALFRDPDFYQQYIDRWEGLRTGPFTQASIEALIDGWNAEINPEVAVRDVRR
ncbi:MAG: Fibronectin type domain protein [Verrucomicrobiales bacterium]|nr:Fibronectin type domain protein [Verrucomicrobiales bacterium]